MDGGGEWTGLPVSDDLLLANDSFCFTAHFFSQKICPDHREMTIL